MKLTVPKATLVLAAFLALVQGCTPAPEEEEPEYDVLYYSTLVRGNDSAIRDTTEMVIRDAEKWAEVKEKLEFFEAPRPVDFGQAMVLLIALPVDTGGYFLDIDRIEYDEERVMVTYIIYEPGSDCLNVAAEITPYIAVEVRRTETPVTFTGQREYEFCNPLL